MYLIPSVIADILVFFLMLQKLLREKLTQNGFGSSSNEKETNRVNETFMIRFFYYYYTDIRRIGYIEGENQPNNNQ